MPDKYTRRVILWPHLGLQTVSLELAWLPSLIGRLGERPRSRDHLTRAGGTTPARCRSATEAL
jgi:hypothetical protein